MKNYKVIKEAGICTATGQLKEKGGTFQGSPRSATIQLLLRCKEIEEVIEKEEPKEPAPPTLEDVKAALTEAGVEYAPNTGEKKLRELFEKLGKE